MTVRTDNPADVGVHVFERSNLGKAPFRCIGVETKIFRASPDSPAQPGGSCDYCGTGIMIHCHIRGADGRTFKVGSDCVAKTGDAGLIKSYKNRPEVRKAKRDAAARKADRVAAEWKALITDPANREKLAALPSGNSYSKNLLEQFEWIWNRCGATGKAKYLKGLKARLAGTPAAEMAGA